MTRSKSAERADRMLHVRLSEEVHQKVRVRCAMNGISMQDYVASLIDNDLDGFDLSGLNENGKGNKK